MLLLMLLFWPGGADTKSPGKRVDSQSQQQIDTLKQKLATAERAARVASGNTTVSESGPLQAAARAAVDKAAAEKAIAESVVTLKGHSSFVYVVAFSPDGKRIVSGSRDNTLKVWDAATGEETLTFNGHSTRIDSVTFSPDGKRVISGSYDNTLKVWDAETGQEVSTLKGHAATVRSVACNPDGTRIVSGSWDKTVKVWDAKTGQVTFTFKDHSDRVESVSFSPDGKRIVSGSRDKTAKLWDSETGLVLHTLKGHSDMLTSVAFSPDGKRIVSGSTDRTVKVWDAETGQEILTFKGHSESVSSVSFSRDGRQIVSGSHDNTSKVWNAQTGQEILTLEGHSESVYSVSFSRDGRRIVSGSLDHTVKIWNLGPAPAQLAATSLPDSLELGLVAYYPFNGNTQDESGNGHHGTTTVEPVFAVDRHGNSNRAYDFVNTKLTAGSKLSPTFTSAITIPDHNDFDLGTGPDRQLTIALWFNRSIRGGGIAKILTSKKRITSSNIDYLLSMTLDESKAALLVLWATGPSSVNGGSAYAYSDIQRSIKSDPWHHVTVNYQQGEFGTKELFLDGELAYRASHGKKNRASDQPLRINALQGSLDDIRIYNRALSEAEVKVLYEYEKP
jgi:Tol biopolymer transport system component